MATTHKAVAPTGAAALRIRKPDEPCAEDARPWVLAATILASALAFIDMMVVGIAVPVIQKDFAAGLGQMQWVVNAYMLVLGALILVGGGLGDRVGRRLIFLLGIAVFVVASAICAIAPNVEVLIVARAIQGVGAALLVPQSLAIIAANFPPDIRGKAIGTWAAASAVTTALGPPLGGFLIDILSWRWAFWINLPLGALAAWLAWQYVPESRDPNATGAIDWTGVAVAVLAFGALTYGLTAISEAGASGITITLAII
jgi:multidrug resistance protein